MNGNNAGRSPRPAVALSLYPEDRLLGIKRDLSAAAEAAQARLASSKVPHRKVQAYSAAEIAVITTAKRVAGIVRAALTPEDIGRFCLADRVKSDALNRARLHALEHDKAQARIRASRRRSERASAMDAARAARRANAEALRAAEHASSTLNAIRLRLNESLQPSHQQLVAHRAACCNHFIEAAKRITDAGDMRCPAPPRYSPL